MYIHTFIFTLLLDTRQGGNGVCMIEVSLGPVKTEREYFQQKRVGRGFCTIFAYHTSLLLYIYTCMY